MMLGWPMSREVDHLGGFLDDKETPVVQLRAVLELAFKFGQRGTSFSRVTEEPVDFIVAHQVSREYELRLTTRCYSKKTVVGRQNGSVDRPISRTILESHIH